MTILMLLLIPRKSNRKLRGISLLLRIISIHSMAASFPLSLSLALLVMQRRAESELMKMDFESAGVGMKAKLFGVEKLSIDPFFSSSIAF
jgi:hypothetical protein